MHEPLPAPLAVAPPSLRAERRRPADRAAAVEGSASTHDRWARASEKGAAPAVRVLPRWLGDYQLFAHIGRGGMADIYLARTGDDGADPRTAGTTGAGGAGRLVVIKELLPHLADSADFARMLVSEALLAQLLDHPNVVRVEGLGCAGDGLFIAMEYVEGLDLREVLRRCARSRVALPVAFSLRIVIEALRGLSFAHHARDTGGAPLGIVHRDVSPSNVLLGFQGEIKLCDFGIARAHAFAAELPEAAIVGKAGYMSPEQARGHALDPRADVFAMGIILWELLAGRRLYRAGEGERLLQVAREARIPALPSRDLPYEPYLHAVVAGALHVDPAARYPSAAAMLHNLEAYADAAEMTASQAELGAWLLESFGHEVVRERRDRERAMRALARGPAAVIEPLPLHDGGASSPRPRAPAEHLQGQGAV